MNILIVGSARASRGGSQTVVCSIGQGLERMGHAVQIYTGNPAQREALPGSNGMPVAPDLERLSFVPDIIHAHQQLPAMCALTALPGIPAVYHSHGALWHHCAPRHPRVYHYITISTTARERLMVETGIPGADISVFLNFVDLARFSKVRRLPAVARRAVFYNSRHTRGSPTVCAVREAARRCALELDLVGYPFGSPTHSPEHLLPEYDIVFASGLSALEAASSGCAVILLGETTCGEMVLPENVGRFRSVNFSMPANAAPPSVENIVSEVRRYAPEGCAQVTDFLRRDANVRLYLDRLVKIYGMAIERHRGAPADSRAEMMATVRHLRSNAPLIHVMDLLLGGHPPSGIPSFDEVSAEITLLERDLGRRLPVPPDP